MMKRFLLVITVCATAVGFGGGGADILRAPNGSSVGTTAGETPDIALFDTVVWASGLKQAKFNSSYDKASGLADSKIDVEVVPGPVMADVKVSNDDEAATKGWTNPYTRTTYYYYNVNTTFAYFGYIWLEAGVRYNFAKNIDDAGYILIGKTTVLDNNQWDSCPVVNYTPAETGWFAVDMRCGDGNGGKGPSSGGIGSSKGLAYNKGGVTTQQADGWDYVRDPNDGSFLRTEFLDIQSMMGMGAVSKDGDDAKVWFRFADVPAAAELRAYYDVADRGDTPQAWGASVKIADIASGDTAPELYTAPGVAANAAVRFALVVKGTDTVRGMYQFSPPVSFAQTIPSVGVVEKATRYTDGDVTVTVNAFGLGESSAAVSVEIADNPDFTGAALVDLGTWNSLKSEDCTIVSLTTNTTYYVRASATNGSGTGYSQPIEIMTLTPTASLGSFLLKSNGSAAQTFLATVTDLGDDSREATITMQCATDEAFSEGLCESDTLHVGEADVGVAKELTVSGLAKNTAYYSRLKIVNAWGFVAYSEPQRYTTFNSLVLQGIGYTAVEGGFNVDVVVSYIDGGSATVELFADGVSLGTQELTAAGSARFAVSSAADMTTFRAVVTGGVTVEKTVSAKKGTSSVVVGDPAEHTTVATMLKVKPGDQITLPPLAGLASYKILNHSFLSLDGTVLTALKPGIVGVEAYGADGALAATIGIIVLPEKIGNGNIYIKKDKSENWGAATHWWNADGTQATDYPHLADDIAIIPDSETRKCYMPIPEGAILGGLYVGRFVNAEGGIVLRYNKLTFLRSDGQPVMIQACSNSRVSGKSSAAVQFADQATEFYYASDTIFDGGWDGIAATMATARPIYNANGTHEIPAGVTLTWRNLDNTKIQQGQNMIDCPILIGEGTVWNRSAAGIKYGRDCSRFTGAYRDSSRGNSGTWVCAPTWLRHASLTNGSVEVYGYVYNSGGSPSISGSGVGFLGTGGDHPSVAPAPHEDSWFPKKGLTMVNSQYDMAQIENSAWKGAPEKKLTDNFTVGQGFSAVIPLNDLRSAASGHPLNWFETADLTHLNKGTLQFDDLDSKNQNNPASALHSVTILHGYKKYAVGGGTDDPKTGPSYPIVPWLVGKSKMSNNTLNFVCVDEDDRVCGVSFNNTGVTPANVTDPNQNVFAWNKSLALNESKTFNSLTLCSNGNSTKMGADKTLTLTSGGLILTYGGSKHSSIGTQTGGADNGALILGDETHPGYVFACSTSATSPCGIWAPTTAKGGLVFGYTGYALLAGDQTGVDDELVVNAGTLDLGSQDKSVACTLDVPVRILANATVKMNNVEMTKQDIYFDDIAGYSGKIELNAAETKCTKLYVRDTPEETEWTALPSGTYGATDSGAMFIDDTRFTGPGILTVRKDDSAVGLQIILR